MVASESRSFTANFTLDGNLQIPDEAKELLRLDGVKQVAIIFDQHGTHFFPLRKTIEEVRGSIPGVPGVSIDFDDEIEEAIAEAMVQKYGRYAQPGDADDLEDENGH